MTENRPAALTGPACRAGRALLKWSMRQLVEASGVSLPTVLKLENDGPVSDDTAAKIRAAFDRHGVEIINGGGTGARLRQGPPSPPFTAAQLEAIREVPEA